MRAVFKRSIRHRVYNHSRSPSPIFALLLLACLPNLGIAAEADKTAWAKQNAERLLLRDDDTPPMLLQAGGPDFYGYFYYDSRDNAINRPVYQWRNITGVGTNI